MSTANNQDLTMEALREAAFASNVAFSRGLLRQKNEALAAASEPISPEEAYNKEPTTPEQADTQLLTSGVPSFSDFLKMMGLDLESQNVEGTNVRGPVDFVPAEFFNKKITIKIGVTDLETNEKHKSKINVKSDKQGSFYVDANSGIETTKTAMDRINVILFSTILESVNELVQEVVDKD